MTDREKEILYLITKNPLISQKEIAKQLSITRSSVGVHITNLSKKGYIKGRGYVISERDYVTVIGAANIDIHGFTEEKLILGDSNPGTVKVCLGGVGRNISENLTKLEIDTKLITALGGDANSKKLIDECKLQGIDMDNILVIQDMSASIYLAIIDDNGDMGLALSDMSVLERITPEFIRSKSHIISNSKIIVLDTGLPTEVIEYILMNFKDSKIFLDPVSIKKARKVMDTIGKFHTIKLNKLEAEYLSNIKIKNEDDLDETSRYFMDKGVKRVFITLGKKGVFYREGDYKNLLPSPAINVVNATGAGDAFMAGVVYCSLLGKDIDYTAKFSTSASLLALSHQDTVSPNMNIEKVNIILKEMF